MKLRVLDLFSGIGGFSLGLERATYEGGKYDGFETVAFCEIEEFPRKVLAKHWPSVPCYRDVRELTAERLAADGIAVDAICGGFPCQDISVAGKRAGIADGTRSGLWSDVARLIGELRPKYVLVENVANLLAGPTEKRGGWFGRVLGDLAERGYDAEWHNIPAAALGAGHRRERIWIVAYPGQANVPAKDHKWGKSFANNGPEVWTVLGAGCETVAHSASLRLSQSGPHGEPFDTEAGHHWQTTQPFDGCLGRIWQSEPPVDRVVDGFSAKLDAPRLAALGNAVVPQIPELIGNAILQAINSPAALVSSPSLGQPGEGATVNSPTVAPASFHNLLHGEHHARD